MDRVFRVFGGGHKLEVKQPNATSARVSKIFSNRHHEIARKEYPMLRVRNSRSFLLYLFFIVPYIPAALASCPGEGQILTSSTGVIKSNYDGLATYSNNNRCKWVVKVQGGYAIDLDMKTFSIPDSRDFLQIDTCTSFGAIETVDDCDASGGRLTGESVGWQFESYVVDSISLSTSAPFVFYFHSNAADVGPGFELTYSVRTCPGSGTTTTSAVGILTDGPGNYGMFAYCDWWINLEGSIANGIRFEFTEFDVAGGDSILIETCTCPPYYDECASKKWRYECSELWNEMGSDVLPPPVTSSALAKVFKIAFSARTASEWAHDSFPGFRLQYGTVCDTGYYSSVQGCRVCSTDVCPAGKIRSGCQLGAIKDSMCEQCAEELPASASWTSGCEWECNSENFERDGVCVPCRVCAEDETEAQACQGSSERLCKPCNICSDKEFEVQQCTMSADRSCAVCKTCSSAEFESSPCAGLEDRRCETCETTTQCQQKGQILTGCGSGARGTCVCDTGWTSNDNDLTCTDVDECANGSHGCDASAVCTNSEGSFECQCNPGYSWDGATCSEIDYCSSNPCDTQAICTDEPPPSDSGICTCNGGYSGSGVHCEDNDECTANTHKCDPKAHCANTMGSFTCGCNAGFYGDGLSCTDLDECASVSENNCDVNSACSNTDGSFRCRCNAGFVDWSNDDIGTSCDENQCRYGTSDCDEKATCTDNEGSFTCTCPLGYTTTDAGVTCAEDRESQRGQAFVLKASTTLEGVQLSTFDAEAEAVFKSAVASLLTSTTPADVMITNKEEVLKRRRLLAVGLKIEYEIGGFASEEAVTAAGTSIAEGSPLLMTSLQQDTKFISLTGVSSDVAQEVDSEKGKKCNSWRCNVWIVAGAIIGGCFLCGLLLGAAYMKREYWLPKLKGRGGHDTDNPPIQRQAARRGDDDSGDAAALADGPHTNV